MPGIVLCSRRSHIGVPHEVAPCVIWIAGGKGIAEDKRNSRWRRPGSRLQPASRSRLREKTKRIHAAHFVKSLPRTPFEQADTHISSDACKSRNGDVGNPARTEEEEGEDEDGMEGVGQASRTSATHVCQTSRRDADAHRSGEDSGNHIGESICPKFGIGIRASHRFVPAAKMLDDARCDQNVYGGHKS